MARKQPWIWLLLASAFLSVACAKTQTVLVAPAADELDDIEANGECSGHLSSPCSHATTWSHEEKAAPTHAEPCVHACRQLHGGDPALLLPDRSRRGPGSRLHVRPDLRE